MTDVIVPTWAEVNGMVALGIASLVILAWIWFKGKKEERQTVTWIRDWNEPNIKEDW